MSSNKNADAAAIALSTLPGLSDLDSGMLEKIEKLELQMQFRSYYFQGGLPKKFVFGVGKDTKLVHYDGLTEERDMFEIWNPRYVDTYIEQAKQYGFHTHFLYFDGKSVEHMSFAEAFTQLQLIEQGQKFYGILAGMGFMNKLVPFFAEYQLNNLTLGKADDLLKSDVNGYVKLADNALQATIGQTSKQFVDNDVGFIAYDEKWWFAGDLYKEWKGLQNEYTRYKERLWEALSQLENVNICTNRVSGIQVGNVNINQINNCIQKINETVGANVENDVGDDGVVSENPNKLHESDESESDESDDVNRISSTVVAKITGYDHEKQLYNVVTTAGEECYLNANDNTLINSDFTQVVDTSFKSNNMFVDKNNVPYDLHFNNAHPTRVIEVVSDTIGRLDTYGLCYVDLDDLTVSDASGYSNYSIKFPAAVAIEYKEKANEDAINLRKTIVSIVTFVVLFFIAIALGYIFYKEHKNAEQEVVDTAAAIARNKAYREIEDVY